MKMRVTILDETGHRELEVATMEELKAKVDLKDKFKYIFLLLCL